MQIIEMGEQKGIGLMELSKHQNLYNIIFNYIFLLMPE